MPKSFAFILVVGVLALIAAFFPMGRALADDSADVGKQLIVQGAHGITLQQQSAKSSEQVIANGYYVLFNARSGKVLNVEGSGLGSGRNVCQRVHDGSLAQTFRIVYSKRTGYYTIRCAASGKALEVAGGSLKEGANVRQATPNGSLAQLWSLSLTADGRFKIRSALNGKALAIDGASRKDGANVLVKKSLRSKAQKWEVASIENWVPDGTYRFKSAKKRSSVLSVANGSLKAGARLRLDKSRNDDAQRFTVTYLGDGAYSIECVRSDRYVSPRKTTSGAAVVQKAASTEWVPVLLDNGIAFRLKENPKLTLGLKSGKTAIGTSAVLQKRAKATSQKWVLVKTTPSAIDGWDRLSITLDQMVKWNWEGNPYNEEYLGTMSALREAIDPDNCDDLEFVDLRKPTKTTAKQLNSYIATHGSEGTLAGLGATFCKAADKYGLNQDYLLAHAILESGWGTSTLASGYYYAGGTIDGTYYRAGTYYNFFGIGAYDSSPLSGGRKLAIINGWNSPKKAVMGAAKWIASNYIHREDNPQYTLYGMKWDYLSSNQTKAYGWHQYATGATWTGSVARLMTEIYARTGTGKALPHRYVKYKDAS